MPQPKIKADAIYKTPVNQVAGAAVARPGVLQNLKVSSADEIESALEPVEDSSRTRLRKPGFTDEPAPRQTAAASRVAAAAAHAPAVSNEPEYDEIEEEVTDNEVDPNELPEGWAAMQDEEGDTFYFNQATQEAQWEKPPVPKRMKKIVKRVPRAKAPAPAPAPAAARFQPKAAAAAPAPAPAAASRFGGASASAASAGASRFGGAASGGAAKAGGASAGAAAGKGAAGGAAVVPSPEGADPEACDAFEANPFKKTICKKCRKNQDKHPQYF